MPLNEQCTAEAYKANVAELIASGFSERQAVAIALRLLREVCPQRKLPQSLRRQVSTAAEQRLRPGPVPQDALEYFRQKQLRPSFNFRDVWREEHNYAFTVAKVMEVDILRDVQAAIDKALEQGQSFQQWKAEVEKLLAKSGWAKHQTEKTRPHRLWTIFRTNTRVARATGQWQRVQRTKRSHPFLQYLLGPSVNHRPEHELLDEMILSADDPLWDIIWPPNGFGCNCHVRQLSDSEAETLGGETDFDELGVEVDSITDEGWDHNPGKERASQLAGLLEERT